MTKTSPETTAQDLAAALREFRSFFLSMTDESNWSDDAKAAGPYRDGYVDAMTQVQEMAMEMFDIPGT